MPPFIQQQQQRRQDDYNNNDDDDDDDDEVDQNNDDDEEEDINDDDDGDENETLSPIDDAHTATGTATGNESHPQHHNHHLHLHAHHHHHDQSPPLLTRWQAMMHLIKGNLGPGCLNLPAAFGSLSTTTTTTTTATATATSDGSSPSSTATATATAALVPLALFALVACQGIYSMWLLVQCKRALQQQQPQSHGINNHHHFHTQPHGPQTFMQVAHAALGSAGSRTTEVFLFVLQGGVCCVFLSLMQTNLLAATMASSSSFDVLNSATAATAVVTALLLVLVSLLRSLKDLAWASLTANIVMVVTIGTAAVAGLQQLQLAYGNDSHNDDNDGSTNHGDDSTLSTTTRTEWHLAAVVQFFPAMFFAFEGIGLVLPIENVYPSPPTDTSTASARAVNPPMRFETVLIQSMLLTAALFSTVGVLASWGFPDLDQGSVTAYLEETFPHNPWYATLNTGVMMAVLLTFPLQLQPALQVLDQWLDDDDVMACGVGAIFVEACRRPRRVVLASQGVELLTSSNNNHAVDEEHDDRMVDEVQQESDDQETTPFEDEPLSQPRVAHEVGDDDSNDPLDDTWCCGIPQWLIRRWVFVLACAVIVLSTNDLSLLIGIFGAIGQTGLAAMPCAIHLALQHQGIVPKCRWKQCLHVGILFFCAAVMISSLATYV